MKENTLVLTPPEPQALEVRQPSAMDLLSIALQKDAAIDVIERLAALQLEGRRLDAEVDFQDALSTCQKEVQLVVVDSEKTGPGGKKWATYKALNKAIRPIYTGHGFSLSFGTADCAMPDKIMVTCLVSRGLHTRTYQLPMDVSGKGPQGGAALSGPHAILAGMEYGRRCLLKMIFNIVTGDEDKYDIATNGEFAADLDKISQATDMESMKDDYSKLYEKYEETPEALKAVVAARKERIKRGF